MRRPMRHRMRHGMRHGMTVTLLLGVAACSSDDDANTTEIAITTVGSTTVASGVVDSTSTSDPVTSPPTTPAPLADRSTVTPQGYEVVAATVTTAQGDVCDVCLWVADTAPQRSQGLMGVTDLGAGDGMAFVYQAPHTGSFWMKNTVLPLSIAFYSEDGDYLDDFDMEPCEADPCPRYPTPQNFTVAIETTQGDLGAIGVGPGSRLVISDVACPEDA